MKQLYLEACVGSVACGQAVSALGVNRLEFCANLEIGGTTPSLASFPLLRAGCDCAINVLIRPRSGDFLYSDAEFSTMLAEIEQFRAMGADGFVVGVLTKDGILDVPRMAQAITAAGGLPVTLHRAFDMTQDIFATLDLAAQLGIATVLTSGQAPDGLQGIAMLKQLQAYSAGRVEIMACGGINADKIAPIYHETGVKTFHMAGLQLCESEMAYRNPNLSMGSKDFDEYTLRKASPALFAAAVQVRDTLNRG
ncbi:MAG: copper homeostasis protein CutC [Faecalibacterium sp.]